jgi:hypothetical protein
MWQHHRHGGQEAEILRHLHTGFSAYEMKQYCFHLELQPSVSGFASSPREVSSEDIAAWPTGRTTSWRNTPDQQ